MKTAYLVELQGQEPGRRHSLRQDRKTTVGRSPQNDIVLLSPSVSRQHCEVEYAGGQWVLRDMGSAKGTLLNGEVLQGEAVLQAGDVIKISQTVLKFVMIDEGGELDEGILAIHAAARAPVKAGEGGPGGGGAASLDAIRARTRMEQEEGAQERQEMKPAEAVRAASPAARKAFLAWSALVALICVIALGLFLTRTFKMDRRKKEYAALAAASAEALRKAEAMTAARAEELPAAVEAMRQVIEKYPDTEAARAALERIPEIRRERELKVWRQLGEYHSAVGAIIDDNRFAEAIRRYKEIAASNSDFPWVETVTEKECAYILKRAELAAEEIARRARSLAEQDRKPEAVRLCRAMADRIGIPEIGVKLRALADELEAGKKPQ